jgi:hypothetical protein
MALYIIIRVYEVPADNRIQATGRMQEALLLHVEKDFHVRDVIREPGVKSGEGKTVDLKPPTGWLRLIKQQLMGK